MSLLVCPLVLQWHPSSIPPVMKILGYRLQVVVTSQVRRRLVVHGLCNWGWALSLSLSLRFQRRSVSLPQLRFVHRRLLPPSSHFRGFLSGVPITNRHLSLDQASISPTINPLTSPREEEQRLSQLLSFPSITLTHPTSR